MRLDFSILSRLTHPKRIKRSTENLIGQKFNHLTPLGYVGSKNGAFWLCRCDCGDFSIVMGYQLKIGHAKTCGCYMDSERSEGKGNFRTHGRSRTRVHRIWCGMHSRCYDPNSLSYEGYGARGIIIDQRWHSFENFYEDMGDPPSDQHSLDRIDNDGNYSPGNCKWSDKFEQARNTRRNRFLTAQGQTYCISQWSEITGLKQGLIAARVRRGWSDEEALEFKERIHRKPLKTNWLRANFRGPSPPAL